MSLYGGETIVIYSLLCLTTSARTRDGEESCLLLEKCYTSSMPTNPLLLKVPYVSQKTSER